jgi:amidase
MAQDELWRLGAADLADKMRSRELKSREVVESFLGRIESVNPAINAVTVVLAEQALEQADRADKAAASGAELGSLHGVPMTVKENIDLAGSATTQGLVAMADVTPPLDAPHIAQMKKAGAIPIGRTNLPDFGLRWHTDNALRGATVNPWDRKRTPGGSSGGEAAALATGMTPLGMGNDYGGSLRWPSQCCGTAAIKPTLGRVPYASSIEPLDFPMTLQLFAVQGPMARHVRDLRLALAAMSGPDARDPWWTPAPLEGPEVTKRVAYTVDPARQGVDSSVAAGVRRAARALSDAGYTVEEVEPPMVAEGADLWSHQVLSEVGLAVLTQIEPLLSEDARTFLQQALETMPPLEYGDYIGSFAARNAIARAWSQFQEDYPLVLAPVFTIQPFEVGFDVAGADESMELLRAARMTVLINLLALPSAAVPVGVDSGLPQGVQIIGPRYREDLCLQAAEAIEAKLGVLTPIDPVAAEN